MKATKQAEAATPSHAERPTRRDFLKAGAAGAVVTAFPAVIPASAFGANERIVYGHIGLGGMGRTHVVPDSCAALCDVDKNRLTDVAKKVQGTPLLTDDYRRVLDRKDIDAVTIGTPDHWHALMTVHACQAGKDVYSEKPTCKTIAEGRAMIEAAKRHKRVVQIGAQGRSNPMAAAACNYLRNGQIGTVQRVDIWHPNNYVSGQGFAPETEPPPHLNWDMWLGPLAWRPYVAETVHFHFRWMMESGGGFIRDRGNHALSIVLWCVGQDNYANPVTVEATGEPNPLRVYDAPETMRVTWKFTKPDWTLTWTQPGTPNPRFPGEWGGTYTGDKGDLIVLGGDGGCDTEAVAKNYTPPANGFNAFLEPLGANEKVDPTERHRRNWRRCIKTRERPAMDIETAVKVITLPIIANIAYQVGRPLTFDPKTGRFMNDAEANRFLDEPYHRPWSLKGVA
jgi:predicted dehydrogenase